MTNYYYDLPNDIKNYIQDIIINEWREKMKDVLVDVLQFNNIYTLNATMSSRQWAKMFLTFLEYKDYPEF
jgi:hypothetical protein